MTKKSIYSFIFIIGSLLLAGNVYAQSVCITIDSYQFNIPDSITPIPSSIKINQQQVQVSFDRGFVKIDSSVFLPFELCFNYLLTNDLITQSSIDPQLYDSSAVFTHRKNKREVAFPKTTQEALGLGGIEIEGGYLRSVSGGQNRGVNTQSALDLQMRGQLSEDLFLKAHLTDQQMPFEPEGNTQRLQDFDRVNIQLSHKDWSIEGGDILASALEDTYFLRYKRQIQGVSISTNRLSIDSATSFTQLSTAISRSKIALNRLEPLEGVLGPYRLEGAQNEPFIFVLAGSEKVYLDGELLVRGFENDYVIDYNAAEITFNTSIYISKFSQLQIEFEYSDRQFARSISTVQHKQQIGRLGIQTNFFTERDQVNNPMESLSPEDLQQLANANVEKGYGEISGVDSMAYQSDQVMYEQLDTIINARNYAYYRVSLNPDNAIYRIQFSQVGSGNGDYVLNNSNSNEQSFKWVPPIEGNSQGNYAPIKKIMLPKKKDIFEIGMKYALKNNDQVLISFASAQETLNRLSSETSSYQGKAIGLGYISKDRKIAMNENWSYNFSLKLEHIDSSFSPLQNFRNPSFNRDWGMTQNPQYVNGEEELLSSSIKLRYKQESIQYHIGLRNKDNNQSGYLHGVDYNRVGIINVSSKVSSLKNQYQDQAISWQKAFFDLNFSKYSIIPGYTFQHEVHQSVIKDSIASSFQNFNQHKFYFTNNDSSDFRYMISHAIRNDYLPVEGDFRLYEASQITQLSTSFDYGTKNQLALNFTRKEITSNEQAIPAETYYQGGINWASAYWQNNIYQTVSYQTGTGRVLERSYFFQEVALGLGTHSWSDLNGNGEKELEEFFEDETNYGDRNYVKLFNFSNSYQIAFINDFRYLLNIKFPQSWSEESLFLHTMSLLSAQWQVNFENKNTSAVWQNRINPFEVSLLDEELLNSKKYIRTTLFINRGGELNGSLAWIERERKQLLLSGFEGGGVNRRIAKGMYNLSNTWSMSGTYENSNHTVFSDVLSEKNYEYNGYLLSPAVQWQYFKNLRLSLNYEFQQKSSNSEQGDVNVGIQKWSVNTKWIPTVDNLIESNVAMVNVGSNITDQLSVMAYDLFEGLRVGENLVWSLSIRKKIFGDLNLSLNYNGRKSPSLKAVQFGSVQLTAIF